MKKKIVKLLKKIDKKKLKNELKEISSYLIIIIVIILLKQYVVAPIRVNGDSMNNTLKDRDVMILNKISYRFQDIKRFDIVVVDIQSEKIIKRVIGLPGDNIEYINNILYVNGKRVEENFDHKRTEDFSIEELGTKKVPDDMYLVLGDNRTNSLDSRIIGFIPKSQIMGKTSLVVFPFSRIGTKN
jgi:signal peptidase I